MVAAIDDVQVALVSGLCADLSPDATSVSDAKDQAMVKAHNGQTLPG